MSPAERSFEAHKIWLSNSNERTEGHVVSLSRKGVHFDAVVTHVFPCKLMCCCVVRYFQLEKLISHSTN